MSVNCSPEEARFEYYKWLLDLVYVDLDSPLEKLCAVLFETEFQWDIPMDKNRAMDGLVLRKRFDPEKGLENTMPEWCSVLEMMVALCDRIETEIMRCDRKGDRTGLWFRIISKMVIREAEVCDTFLSFCDTFEKKSVTRLFEKNSDFRLFLSKKYPKTLPKVEIWDQLHAFLLENYDF